MNISLVAFSLKRPWRQFLMFVTVLSLKKMFQFNKKAYRIAKNIKKMFVDSIEKSNIKQTNV